MRFLGMFLLVLTAGCGSTTWAKQGATKDDFANDKQHCNLYARQMNENYSAFRGAWHDRIFSDCMTERGWSLAN